MNLVHLKKRVAPRAALGRTNGTNSLADTKRCVQKKKTREHETDEKMIPSTTHTATKRRPAITKGPAEREADEPTREDKDDVGPSARATAGKRASTASTKVRNTVLVCLLLFFSTDDRPIAPTKRSRAVGWVSSSHVLLFQRARRASIDVIDRSSTGRDPIR